MHAPHMGTLNKMAVVALSSLLIQFFVTLSGTKATTVEVTVPVHPVTVGNILALKCTISNKEEGHTVKMFRVINDHTEELTTGDDEVVRSVLGQRGFLAKRNIAGGALVYFLTIVGMTKQDEGEYLCKVYAFSRGDYVKIAEGSANIDVYYLPSSIYPLCQSTPEILQI